MKKFSIGCLFVLLALGSAAWAQSGGTEKAVAGLEQQWLQGQKTNNPDLVAPLLADKIVVTQSDGKVTDRSETIAIYKKTKWDSVDYTDVKVTVYERFTDTWVKMPSGKWQCVASHVSPVM
jgi:hypothetical protein